jgi:ATP-dependent Lon protease
MPDGNTTVIIQGKKRFKINEMISEKPYLKRLPFQIYLNKSQTVDNEEFKAIIDSIKDLSLEIIKESPNIPTEATFAIKNIESNSFLVNFVSSNMNLKVERNKSFLR